MRITNQRLAVICAVAAAAALLFPGCPPKTAVPPVSRDFVSTRDLAPPKDEIPKIDNVIPKPALGRTRIMGIQVLLFTSNTQAGLDDEMKRIAATGADTVIVRVFNNKIDNKVDRFYPFITPRTDAGVYFNTDRAPVVADALSPMIDAARKNGLKIWAWMTTRYAVWGDDPRQLRAYDFTRKMIIPAFGRDLFDDRKVADLVGLYQDLAAYDIDGILLQDDLILKHNEGMGETAERLFGSPIRPETFYNNPHLSPDGSKYYAESYTDRFREWSRFKSARLSAVAGEIIKGSRAVRPDLKFAVNLYYEALSRPENGLAWFSQDVDELLKSGVDYVFIMAYHRQIMKEKGFTDLGPAGKLLTEITSRAIPAIGDPARVGIKLQVMDWDTGRPVGPEELRMTASYLKQIDSVSLVFVPYVADAPFTEMRGIFRTALGKVN
jgi:biofilm PGA synthesis lipoprotein PgaB